MDTARGAASLAITIAMNAYSQNDKLKITALYLYKGIDLTTAHTARCGHLKSHDPVSSSRPYGLAEILTIDAMEFLYSIELNT